MGGLPYHLAGRGQYTSGPLQFITASAYRRAPIFLPEPFCRCLVEAWAEARQALGRLTYDIRQKRRIQDLAFRVQSGSAVRVPPL